LLHRQYLIFVLQPGERAGAVACKVTKLELLSRQSQRLKKHSLPQNISELNDHQTSCNIRLVRNAPMSMLSLDVFRPNVSAIHASLALNAMHSFSGVNSRHRNEGGVLTGMAISYSAQWQ